MSVLVLGDLKQSARTYEYDCLHTVDDVTLSGVIIEDDPRKRLTYRASGSCQSERTFPTAIELESWNIKTQNVSQN